MEPLIPGLPRSGTLTTEEAPINLVKEQYLLLKAELHIISHVGRMERFCLGTTHTVNGQELLMNMYVFKMLLMPFSDEIKGLPHSVRYCKEKLVIYQDHSESEIVLVYESGLEGDLPKELDVAINAGVTIVCFCNPKLQFKTFRVKLRETKLYQNKIREFRGAEAMFKSDPDCAILYLKTFEAERLKTLVYRQLYFSKENSAILSQLPQILGANVFKTTYRILL
jgi:hypothetical protein